MSEQFLFIFFLILQEEVIGGCRNASSSQISNKHAPDALFQRICRQPTTMSLLGLKTEKRTIND